MSCSDDPGCAEATTFSLMLRRADNVPVGLHVQGTFVSFHSSGLQVCEVLPFQRTCQPSISSPAGSPPMCLT